MSRDWAEIQKRIEHDAQRLIALGEDVRDAVRIATRKVMREVKRAEEEEDENISPLIS